VQIAYEAMLHKHLKIKDTETQAMKLKQFLFS
jgi:hypothetical protein